MSLFRGSQQRAPGDARLESLLRALGLSSGSSGPVPVTADSALRHSAVWAACRLRADLVSTTPVDVFRRVEGVQVEVPKPPLLTEPDGGPLVHWLYSTQFDLDRYGNAFGVVTARDSSGLPARVELVAASEVVVRGRGPVIDHWLVAGKRYEVRDVWHERQHTVAGLPLGLSPIAYAAWSIGGYLSAQQFALDWFDNGVAPSGHFKNTEMAIVEPEKAEAIKQRFKQAVKGRDVLVTGKDWEFNLVAADAAQAQFLEQMKYGVSDIARFFGVPGDLLEAEVSTGSITYANVTQRNLQLLVLNLGPVFVRREAALSAALPKPRYVKFNTDALLRMDPQTRANMLLAQVAGRVLAPSEARELDNRPPFTPEQETEFDRLFGSRAPKPPQQSNLVQETP